MVWPTVREPHEVLVELTESYRLDKTGSVRSITRVDDASGGYTETLGATTTFPMGLATGIKGQQALQQRLVDRIGNKPYFIIVCPVEVDIQLEQVITEVETGRTFNVLGIENEGISLQLLQRLAVIEIIEV